MLHLGCLATRQMESVNFTCDLQSEDERGPCCLTDDVILTDSLKLSPRCFTTCSLVPATCKVHSCPDRVTLHETIISQPSINTASGHLLADLDFEIPLA